MLVVALTGGIGAGKSTVAQFFAQLGALVVDADQLAKTAIERGSDGFAEVMMRFGDEIIVNGDIDRKKLAEIIFSDAKARADLEAIIHPKVQALFAEVVSDLNPNDILIYEIPLLVETAAASKFDYIITVEADIEVRKERLLKKGLYISQIEKRIAAQAYPAEREAIANTVLLNNADEDALLRQVENLLPGFVAEAGDRQRQVCVRLAVVEARVQAFEQGNGAMLMGGSWLDQGVYDAVGVTKKFNYGKFLVPGIVAGKGLTVGSAPDGESRLGEILLDVRKLFRMPGGEDELDPGPLLAADAPPREA